MKELKNIKNFIFDCDGVLYRDLDAVFGQVSKRMTEYIAKKLNLDLKKAKELQTNYFHKYNTSLSGLMIHHDIKPSEFLKYVHEINLDFMKKDLILRKELLKLNAKKFVFTNGSHEHIINITKHLGIYDLFDGAFDITDCNYIPKPAIEPYKTLINKFNIKPEETIFTSSGTTGSTTSKHYVADLKLYETSFLKAFERQYGNPSNFVILALLPSYLEREGSSLIFMVDKLIELSNNPHNGFYLFEMDVVTKLDNIVHFNVRLNCYCDKGLEFLGQ